MSTATRYRSMPDTAFMLVEIWQPTEPGQLSPTIQMTPVASMQDGCDLAEYNKADFWYVAQAFVVKYEDFPV